MASHMRRLTDEEIFRHFTRPSTAEMSVTMQTHRACVLQVIAQKEAAGEDVSRLRNYLSILSITAENATSNPPPGR